MLCPTCQAECRKYGKNRNGSQRHRCDVCKKNYTDEATRPADRRKLDRSKLVMALRLFLEGNSIRSTERLLNVHRDTIMDLIVRAGIACKDFHTAMVRDVEVTDVECDELWSFVGCKERTKRENEYGEDKGDCYTFTALERESKLLLTWHVGKRDSDSTERFCYKLRHATAGHFQVSTDGFRPYGPAMFEALYGRVEYGRVIKTFGPVPESRGASRYSPPQVIGIEKVAEMGQPDLDYVCTSHVERQNLSIRMAVRRFTRLTNAHSKKWANHDAAIALYFVYYNFCRVHSSIGTTPAVKAGLTDRKWTVEELLEKIGV
jgi:transposase-like protein/IS1 family transposase